jgi:glycosyltransferase involved in cell wall biosynthesis
MVQSKTHFESVNRKMRILFVNFSYVIDVYQRKLEIASRIGNVEIGVLAPRNWKMREWNKTFALQRLYPDIQYFPATIWFFNGRQGGYLFSLTTIIKTIIIFKPDIIQVEQEVFSLVAFQMALISRIFKIPLVIFCWENMDKQFSLIRQFTRRFVFKTATVINPGNCEAASLMQKWGYQGKIEVLPQLGVDTELFQPAIQKSEQGRVFSFGYIGRLVPEKGVDLIFLAAKRLMDNGYAFEIVIGGTGSEERVLRRLADNLNLSNRTVWLGAYPYKDVPFAISKMDVLVLPSRTLPGIWKEQFGHVLVEAMAMGIPVIGSSSGSIPDVIGRPDLIFKENDVSGLAAILEAMIGDKSWREQLGQYGYHRVMNNYSHEIVAKKMIRLWEDVGRNRP